MINAAVILKSRLELYSKGGIGMTRALGPGEALIEVVNTVHAGKPLGSEDVDLVVFDTGSQGQPTTVLSK